MAKEYRLEEINKHTAEDDCWVIIHGKVYDVTDFLDSHPGGPEYLTDFSGSKSVCQQLLVTSFHKRSSLCSQKRH